MIYCYRAVQGNELVEVVMSDAERAGRQDADGFIVLDDGRKARRSIADEHRPNNYIDPWATPMLNEALAVWPDQVAEARADAARKGVPTDFARDGRVVIRSQQHYRQFCKAYGVVNKGDFY